MAGNGMLPTALQGLSSLSGTPLNAALGDLAGQTPGAFELGAFQAGGAFLGLMLDPFADGRGGSFVGAPAAYAYAGDESAAPAARALAALVPAGQGAPAASPYTAWGSAYGGGGSLAGDSTLGTARTSSSYYGMAAGVDYRARPGLTIGVAVGGGGTGFSAQGLLGGSAQFAQFGLYGHYQQGPLYLSTALAGSAFQVSATRADAYGFVGAQTASFTVPALSMRNEVGYGLDAAGGLRLTPYLAHQIQTAFLPSYVESSSFAPAASLFYDSRRTYDDRTEFGARFEQVYAQPCGTVKLLGRVAYAHDVTNAGVSNVSFVAMPGGGSFASYAAKIAPDNALATLGADYRLRGGWSLAGKLDGQFASSGAMFAAQASLRKTW
jgi:uncharacterized protein with beta-barrel porin domain